MELSHEGGMGPTQGVGGQISTERDCFLTALADCGRAVLQRLSHGRGQALATGGAADMRILSMSGHCYSLFHRGGSLLAECTFDLPCCLLAEAPGDGRTEGDNAYKSVRLHACCAKHSVHVSCDCLSVRAIPGGRKSQWDWGARSSLLCRQAAPICPSVRELQAQA